MYREGKAFIRIIKKIKKNLKEEKNGVLMAL